MSREFSCRLHGLPQHCTGAANLVTCGAMQRRNFELFLIGAFTLFLELVLIRWLGTEIRLFAYLGNLILVVCFFGVGLGCYLSSQPLRVERLGLNLLLLAALVANPLHASSLDLKQVTTLLSGFEGSPIWNVMWDSSGVRVWAGLALIGSLLYLVAFTFVPAGQMLGRAMDKHPRIVWAYSANVAGSLAGVWLFNLLAWRSAPPPFWFAVVAALAAPLMATRGRQGWIALALTAIAPVMIWLGQTPGQQTVWSPYQKLSLSPYYVEGVTNRVQRGYMLEVNGTHFQQMVDASDAFFASHPDIFNPEDVRRSHLNTPFPFKPDARRVLIVGAGSGNNAAAALRHGVEQVDCVEIDPQIYAFGRRYHPEHPYDSPRVHVVVNDARAFFKQATGPYDVIWFAWLDAHTQASSYNNLRLDHYVYTEESFREAKRLLAPDGILFVNFNVIRPWIGDRLFVLMRRVFGHDPLVYQKVLPAGLGTGSSQYVLVCADQPLQVSDPELRAALTNSVVQMSGTTRPTTDDWPYLYLQFARIPKLHLITMFLVLGTVVIAGRRVYSLSAGLDWHFFALGAAFLLLEVQAVSRATLLFGMTWTVNAIVISAVLVMILAANFVAARWPAISNKAVVLLLFCAVALLGIVPLDWFNRLTGISKIGAASAFLTAPVFFSGLLFIQSFATCVDKPAALGSNLFGALVGGLLESLSFRTGIRALVILVGLFYLLAVLTRRSKSEPGLQASPG
jgi:spermidine synthase